MALSLQKDTTRTLVSAATPPQPSVASLAFHMYATPPPLGWQYKAYSTNGVDVLPNSVASYYAWPWQIHKPAIFLPNENPGEWQFMTDKQFAAYLDALGVNSLGAESAYPVVDAYGELTGFMVYVIGAPTAAVRAPPQYWGPLPYMTYVTFPDVPVASNGHPTGAGYFRGYFDVPTMSGITRCWGTYWKDGNGILLRIAGSSDPLPPYCVMRDSVTYNPARVVTIENFPGRAAVPGTPAIFAVDGQAGWNAGAISVSMFDGDCRTSFTPSVVSAVAVGLAAAAETSTDPAVLTHALYFDNPLGTALRCCVLESGRRVSPYFSATNNTSVFVIERIAGVVSIQHNGVLVHASRVVSSGMVRVRSSLYLGGDGVY